MRIETPQVIKVVKDIDIVMEGGVAISVTLDETKGDTMSMDDRFLEFHLTAKESMNDPTKTLPAEDIKIFVNHILTIQSRDREVVELTPDQKADWVKEFEQLNVERATKH